MDSRVKEIQSYLENNLIIKTNPVIWENKNKLALFFINTYDFYTIQMHNQNYLLIIDKNINELTPAKIKKHITLLQQFWDSEIIYVTSNLTSYNKQRLIENKISFIVPNNQMYLPLTGIDLREHFKNIRKNPIKFMPSTQVVVLYSIINNVNRITPLEFSKILNYSKMTMSRAFDDLELADLVDIHTDGRERILKFKVNKHELWEASKQYFQSPILKKIIIKSTDILINNFYSGLSALSKYSLISPANYEIYAIDKNLYKVLKSQKNFEELHYHDYNTMEIEIWKYFPGILSNTNYVDPFSLYLSFFGNTDERIGASLDKMMENYKW